jgi:dihydrofolate reductase
MHSHLIWAQDLNGGIGIDNKLPWYVSEDLKNFKSLTKNSAIIMGRKTWDSLKIRPLPDRRNIVLSSNVVENIECYNSLDELFNNVNNLSSFFVIGGAEIYKLFYPQSQELHITFIDRNVDNIDTFFPIKISQIKKEFKKISSIDLTKDAVYTNWIRK